jgi:hypothetical protein
MIRAFILALALLLQGIPFPGPGRVPVGGGGSGITEDSSQRCVSADNTITCTQSAVTSGKLLVCGGAIYNSSDTLAGGDIHDSVGTSWTVLYYNNVVSIQDLFIMYGFAGGSGANTITLSTHAGAERNFGCTQFENVNATPFSVDGGSASGTDMAPTTAITTTVTNSLVAAVMAHVSGASTLTAGTGFTEVAQQSSVANDPFEFEFKVVTTATTYNPNWTTGSTVNWGAASAAFKP